MRPCLRADLASDLLGFVRHLRYQIFVPDYELVDGQSKPLPLRATGSPTLCTNETESRAPNRQDSQCHRRLERAAGHGQRTPDLASTGLAADGRSAKRNHHRTAEW